MQTRPLTLRIAVVQMQAHPAVEAPGHVYLGEPLGDLPGTPHLGRLHTRLSPDSPLLPDLERLQRSVAAAYSRGLLARLRHILEFCRGHKAGLVVFPEYSIPGALLPSLRDIVESPASAGDPNASPGENDLALVAGTHHVTDDLLLDPDYLACFESGRPSVNHAIAPVIRRGLPVDFQTKLWRSQWEPFLSIASEPRHFQHRDVSFGVAICIDFLRHRDGESAEIHQAWTGKDHLIVVTSATPDDSPRAFEASARDLFQHFQIPVAFANLANYGGSSIFAYGKPGGEPLAADTLLPPLPARHEGVLILEVQLHQPTRSRPTHLLHLPPAQPIVYALIRPAYVDRSLALAAQALSLAPDPAAFRARCREHQSILARASREFADVDIVQKRWDRLAKGARGIHDIEHLRRLASDLWLPDEILSIPEIEHALASGTIQVLRGLAERAVSEQDRKECTSTLETLGRAIERLSVAVERADTEETRSLQEDVVNILSPGPISNIDTPIRADGSVDAWLVDPGAVSPPLLDAGFRLWPRITLDDPNLAGGSDDKRGVADLLGYLDDLDDMATWLAIQGSPPAWVGWSPRGTPVLVIPPGHIVLVSHVVPPTPDLGLARGWASKPLPIGVLIGPSEPVKVKLPPDFLPLPEVIRRLALDNDHLRELADFEYSRVRLEFIEPMCTVGFEADIPSVPALAALDDWLLTAEPLAVLCGAIQSGRTTLVKVWLASLARSALLGDGAPVLYVDGVSWREHSNLSGLIARFTPSRLAALRLAVSTGNCILVLDGFDDIRPGHLLKHPFFRGWLSPDSLPRLLIVSCWAESNGELIRLGPIDDEELSPLKARRSRVDGVPRSLVAAANTRRDLVHPQPELLRSLLAKYDAVLAGARRTEQPTPVSVLLADLARALWTGRASGPQAHAIRESEFRRLRAEWRPGGGEPDPILRSLTRVVQDLVSFEDPAPDTRSPRWAWRTFHAAFRAPRPSPARRRGDERSLSISLDPLVDFLLAEEIIRALIQQSLGALDVLPLHADTVDYCVRHARWPEARETVLSILRAPPSTPTISINALLLACGDDLLASTADSPWQLPGLDLRCLRLQEARLAHANLAGALLTHTSLVGANLRRTDLTGACLDDSDLRRADLAEASLPRAHLAGARLDGATFSGGNLTEADLSRTIAEETAPDLTNALVDGMVLHAAAWVRPALPENDLARVDAAWLALAPTTSLDEVIVIPSPHEGAFAWSSDDHMIAFGDIRGALWLWSSGPLRCIAYRAAHPGTLRAIEFSPDGKRLATSGDGDQHVRLWDAYDLEPAGVLEHDRSVTGLYWESERILWTFAGTPRRWDVDARPPSVEEISSINDAYEGILTDDLECLVTISRDAYHSEKMSAYLRTTGECISTLHTRTARLPSLDRDRDRAIVERERAYEIRDLRSPTTALARIDDEPLSRGRITPHPLQSWSPSGRFVALLWHDNRVRLFHGTAHCRTFGDDALGVLFAKRDERVFVVSERTLAVFDANTGVSSATRLARMLGEWALDLRWTSVGLLYHNRDHIVSIDLAAANCTVKRRDHRHRLGSGEAEPDSARTRFVFSDGHGFAVWNAETNERILLEHPPPLAGDRYWSVSFASWSPDGALVMVQRMIPDKRAECTIWDSHSGKVLLHELLPGVGNVVLVKQGRLHLLVERTQGEFLHLIDAETGAHLTVRTGSLDRTFASDDANHIFVLSQWTDLMILDVRAALLARLVHLAAGDRQEVSIETVATRIKIGHSGVGEIVARSDHDVFAFVTLYEVQVYRLSDGKHLRTLPTRLGMATALALTRDARYLACHFLGDVQIWDLHGGEVVARIELLDDGAVVFAGSRFQRLEGAKSAFPSLEGFYARTGVNVWPLERFAHLESRDLCADLRRTFLDNDEPSGPQDLMPGGEE